MGYRLRIDDLEIGVPEGTTLFDAAESLGVRVPTSCQKQGKCRECLFEIEAGEEHLSDPEPQEEHLGERFRLSCRARLARPGIVRAHTMRRGALRIEESAREVGDDREPGGDPRFRRDGERLLCGDRPVGRITTAPLGLAVDVGTTTVVLRLDDLESGRRLATLSFENPQRFGGSDVMSRIRYDTDHRGRLLQRVLLGYLARAIDELPGNRSAIVDVVIAANTTMRDLLFGLDVASIGQLPYRSLTEHELDAGARSTTGLDLAASRLRLELHPAARVYGLPLVSSHVGADAAACLLATDIADRKSVSACMDIGTNTEVIIGNCDRILAASCPAGPAFEGGGVLCGVPGLDGAIEHLRLNERGVESLEIVGGGPPIGICGSGLIDLLGELLRTGRMNAQGRYTSGDRRFVLDRERRIALTEADITELAQAKGANAAGMRILAHRFGIDIGEIDRLYLAGGFGRHIDVSSARRIGLIPDLPEDRVFQVGNAALEGASLALHSVDRRDRLERLVRAVEHVSLESQDNFFDYFVDGCQFEPFGGDGE